MHNNNIKLTNMALVKRFNDFKRKVNEGWTGPKANKAYDQMINLFNELNGEQIADAIWNCFGSETIEEFYDYLIDEEYIFENRTSKGSKRLNEGFGGGMPNIDKMLNANGEFDIVTVVPNGSKPAKVIWVVTPKGCNGSHCDMSARVSKSDSPKFKVGDDVFITLPKTATVEDVATEIIDTWTTIRDSVLSGMYESLGSDWAMAREIGYEPKTTFWDDFSIADRFGANAIKDTYKRAFNEWKDDYIYLTELVMVLNHKIWQWYEKDQAVARIYNDLWEKTNDYACTHLKGNELKYFYKTTD